MQLIYMLLILCVAMAALKVALMALIVIFGIGLLCCMIRYPAKTIGFMLLMVTMSLVERHPLAAGIGLVATAIVAATTKPS
ncbi:hypothetical protein [Sphingobium yanoikuyae]|jgi:hypothetical protein|uniref:hypothetical protein n=1 Tax=Sphingobium yanoikuyae TaxID=13690 RepID=UPI0004E43E5C|nr:hypothetical protein [Sphingobium yanoikuyae]KFD25820.1 hypothetical protein IH86_23400 [Sphingobium yanoikuyae]KZC74980.1 hypothetical protein AYR46_23470 [Sphingobium yanoikuyae]MDV3478623.1 hypothetical protein [Sphingobium yanoikuyae]